jgi:transposase
VAAAVTDQRTDDPPPVYFSLSHKRRASVGQARCLRSWFMPQNFIFPQRDQPLLMPVDMREWLPEDDLVFVVLDAVATLDLGEFRLRYRADGHGRAAFDPEMMVALLLYGYCQGERSSRVIEKRCVRDVGYRVVAGGLRPDHATIARFRARLGGKLDEPTPRTLARRAERRERLAAARDRLDAEDKERRDAQRARQEAWDAAAATGKRGGRRPADEPRTNRNNTEPRANVTDPDCRVMRNQKGYVAGYNGQLVVTPQQVIVGAMLSQHPVDRTLLHPLPDHCRAQLTAAGIRPKLCTVLADSGYVTEDNYARAEQQKLRLLAPLGKDPVARRIRAPQRARNLDRLPATARAVRRMRHHRGRADYKLRAQTVEPVFGQIKACMKMTAMSRRGLSACRSEWLLAATAHNLRKLHAHHRSA